MSSTKPNDKPTKSNDKPIKPTNKFKRRERSPLANLINTDEQKQPLVPRICYECYELLTEAIANADHHTMVATHCPHYMTLTEVELHEGVPLGTIISGPLTREEAEAKINESFDFDPATTKQ